MGRGGFPGGGFGGGGANMQQLLRQAQKMQADMEKAQKELEEAELEVSSGGGMVVCKVSGKGELKSLKINPEIVDPDDVETLEDILTAAVNEAMRAADTDSANNMSRLTGGLNLGGLF